MTDIESIFTKTKTKKTPDHSYYCSSLSVTTQNSLLAISAGYNEECLWCQEAIYHIRSTDKETIVTCQGDGEKKDLNSECQPLFHSSDVRNVWSLLMVTYQDRTWQSNIKCSCREVFNSSLTMWECGPQGLLQLALHPCPRLIRQHH